MTRNDLEARLRAALAGHAARVESTRPDPAIVRARANHVSQPSRRTRNTLLSALAAAAVVVAVVLISLSVGHKGNGHQSPINHNTTSVAPSPTLTGSSTTPAAAACAPGQLRFAYRGGTYGTQDDFGSIGIVNTSAQDCTLDGAVQITPMNSHNQPLPASIAQPQVVHARRIVLSANGVLPEGLGTTAPNGQHWAQIQLGGAATDPTTGKVCTGSAGVTPAAWRLTGATGSTVVDNLDPSVSANAHGLARSVFACTEAGKANFLNFSISAQ